MAVSTIQKQPIVISGTKVITVNNTSYAAVLTAAEINAQAGTNLSGSLGNHVSAIVCNGDWNTRAVSVRDTMIQYGSVLVHFGEAFTGDIRVNYIVSIFA